MQHHHYDIKSMASKTLHPIILEVIPSSGANRSVNDRLRRIGCLVRGNNTIDMIEDRSLLNTDCLRRSLRRRHFVTPLLNSAPLQGAIEMACELNSSALHYCRLLRPGMIDPHNLVM